MIRLILLFVVLALPVRADFVLNNLRMTLYHELAHAVIDQHEVPLFGPEETAADTFALVLANRLHGEDEMTAMVQDMVAVYRADAARALFDPWAEYMPTPQRLAYAICLYYGQNPEVRRPLALAMGLRPDERRPCVERAASVTAAWGPVLDRIAPSEPTDSLRPARLGKALRLLGKDIARVNRTIALPRPIPVQTEACGEDNAFYYHFDERIVFCHEMVTTLRRRARDQ
ncbi:hypothetical protein JANAI62_17450 [Jannaschia pagri]|uniref:Metallopeptidase n=1 Tax=Jannaschia pagri TaxID=2829797 RepID=A0ABQ4NL21_9RHOB|nr:MULTISPECIES: DUF4344 domain-containing metallopeptidase [unclassified Jannaschia]GIT91289.1 hypothetical protein JANAI61_17470 [Jannaschia sp. AI_61]GIT95122.1 hypothetical protein JANAI62_17450 [Jannaschia sp. AI_62]